MLYIIEQLLTGSTKQQVVQLLQSSSSNWNDGKLTAGVSARSQKNNIQLSSKLEACPALSQICLQSLQNHPVFMSAALPKTIIPPLFSQYTQGHHYGKHVDNALQVHPDSKQMIRTDLSLTLFLSEPDSYEGGELVIDDAYGEHAIKLKAGDAVLYPSTSIHRVNAVTSGQRLAMVTWIQSLVKSNEQRQILHDLDISHILLRQKHQNLDSQSSVNVNQELDKLSQSYHNLLRFWVEC